MTGKPDEGWKILSDKEDAENVPLWKALAQFTSEDLDEGLKENAAVLDREKPIFQRYYNLAFVVSFVFGGFFLIFLFGLLISIHSKLAGTVFYIVLALLAVAIAPQLWRHIYQYGVKIPNEPLGLPHAPNRHFEEFLSYLQKADGPKAYYLTRFRKKRTPFNRRQFFGRLRYFLFSEHGTDRTIVTHFPAMLPILTDLYLHRDDVQRIIAMSKPKRKGGSGAKAKYPYEDAIVSLIGDPGLAQLDLRDRDAALQSISNRIIEWFTANGDPSGNIPRSDYPRVRDCSQKIYGHLKNISRHSAR